MVYFRALLICVVALQIGAMPLFASVQGDGCVPQKSLPAIVRQFKPLNNKAERFNNDLKKLIDDSAFIAEAVADQLADHLHYLQTMVGAKDSLDFSQELDLWLKDFRVLKDTLGSAQLVLGNQAAERVANRPIAGWLQSEEAIVLGGGIGFVGGIFGGLSFHIHPGAVLFLSTAVAVFLPVILKGIGLGVDVWSQAEKSVARKKSNEAFLKRLLDRGLSESLAKDILISADFDRGLQFQTGIADFFENGANNQYGVRAQIQKILSDGKSMCKTQLSEAVLAQLESDLLSVQNKGNDEIVKVAISNALRGLAYNLKIAADKYPELMPVLASVQKTLAGKIMNEKIKARKAYFDSDSFQLHDELTRQFFDRAPPEIKTGTAEIMKSISGIDLRRFGLEFTIKDGDINGTLMLGANITDYKTNQTQSVIQIAISLKQEKIVSELAFLNRPELWGEPLKRVLSGCATHVKEVLQSETKKDQVAVNTEPPVSTQNINPASEPPRIVRKPQRVKPKLEFSELKNGVLVNPADPSLQIFPPALAQGGEGEVFLARRGFKKIAVKRLGERATQNDHRRFKEKVEFAGKVFEKAQSDHVLPVEEYHPEASPPFAVLPLVEGPNLDQILTQHQLKPGAIVSAVEQTIEGLKDVHRVGIFSDLKPGNILVENGHLILTDMGTGVSQGVVVSLGKTTTTAEAARSMYFFPPNEKVPDKQWDIYSLGAVFYTMLAGGMDPTPDISLQDARKETEYAKLNEGLKHWPESAIVIAQKILDRSLTKFKSRRFKSVEEFETEFAKLKEILKDSESGLDEISNQVWSEIIAKRKEAERTVAEAAKPESVRVEMKPETEEVKSEAKISPVSAAAEAASSERRQPVLVERAPAPRAAIDSEQTPLTTESEAPVAPVPESGLRKKIKLEQ